VEENNMKPLLRYTVLAASLVVLAGVHNASAQIDSAIEFTTSFPFIVGNTTVPAGSYTITPADEDPQILELQGGHTAVLIQTESADPPQSAHTEIVFNRYGDRYVLKNIWVEGSDVGYVSSTALGERRVSKVASAAGESRVAARKTARKTAAE
jgi:hypothetical protein